MRKLPFTYLLNCRAHCCSSGSIFSSARCFTCSVRRVSKQGNAAYSAASFQPIVTVPTWESYRSFSATTLLLESAGDLTAMEVAIEVNKLKKAHQASAGPVKKEIEKEAWDCLQKNLSDSNIQTAEGKAVALLLNSWAYFAKFWEKGKDGPILPEEPASREASTSEPQA